MGNGPVLVALYFNRLRPSIVLYDAAVYKSILDYVDIFVCRRARMSIVCDFNKNRGTARRKDGGTALLFTRLRVFQNAHGVIG